MSNVKKYLTKVREAIGIQYSNVTYLCEGDHARIYTAEKKDVSVIVKQSKNDDNEEEFKNEVEACRIFEWAPEIVDSFHRADHYYIIMERYAMMLDEYLRQPRSSIDLDQIVAQLIFLLKQLRTSKIIHGDFALFNIAVCDTDEGLRLHAIDFGSSIPDADTTLMDETMIDLMRLVVEIYAPTEDQRSTFSADRVVCAENMTYLQTKLFIALEPEMKLFVWKGMDDHFEERFEKVFPESEDEECDEESHGSTQSEDEECDEESHGSADGEQTV